MNLDKAKPREASLYLALQRGKFAFAEPEINSESERIKAAR